MTTKQLRVFAKQNGLVFLGTSIRTKQTGVYVASVSRINNKITGIVIALYSTPNQRKLLQAYCLIHSVPCSK